MGKVGRSVGALEFTDEIAEAYGAFAFCLRQIDTMVNNILRHAEIFRKVAAKHDVEAEDFRAERRMGEFMRDQKEAGLMNKGGRPPKAGLSADPVIAPPTLSEIGLSKDVADRCRKVAAVSTDEFSDLITEWRDKVSKETEKVTSRLFQSGKKALERAEKEAALANKIASLPDEKFGVIYADPPWRFQVRSKHGMDRSADNHYPTQTTDDICAHDVSSISADDCVLILWATVPMPPDVLTVYL